MIGKTEGVCRSVIVRGARRQLRPDLGHAGADVVERLDHVGLGGEVDRQLGGPADRFRPDAHHPEHDADRLLDRPGDGHLDVLDRQAGRLGDHDDPREGDLGVDAAGHAEHRNDAEGSQEARGQDDQPEVRPGPGDEVDSTAGVRVSLGFRLQGQAHCPASAWPTVFASTVFSAGFSSTGFSSTDFTFVPSGKLYPPSTITGSPSLRSVPDT